MHIKNLIMFTLMLCLGTAVIWANPQVRNELYLVTDFTYSSDDLGTIEKGIREANEILKKYGFPFSHTIQIGEDNKVTYFYKLRNYADFDVLNKFWSDFPRRAGADFNRFLAACGDVASAFSSIWNLRQDLSYTSANKPLSLGLNASENYTVRNFYYFKATEQRKAESFFQDLKKLYQSKRIPGEYRVLLSSLGADRLCFSVEYTYESDPGGKSIFERDGKINLKAIPNWSLFGAEGQNTYQELFNRTDGILRKTEVKKAQWRPDLYLKSTGFKGQWRPALKPRDTRIIGSN